MADLPAVGRIHFAQYAVEFSELTIFLRLRLVAEDVYDEIGEAAQKRVADENPDGPSRDVLNVDLAEDLFTVGIESYYTSEDATSREWDAEKSVQACSEPETRWPRGMQNDVVEAIVQFMLRGRLADPKAPSQKNENANS